MSQITKQNIMFFASQHADTGRQKQLLKCHDFPPHAENIILHLFISFARGFKVMTEPCHRFKTEVFFLNVTHPQRVKNTNFWP